MYKVFQIAVRGGCVCVWGGSEILHEEIFLPGEGNLRRNDFDDSKEYEIKTKMEQQQWLQLKMLFLLGYNMKIVV